MKPITYSLSSPFAVWEMSFTDDGGILHRLPATVPGSTIADLMAGGLLPVDIFWRDHSSLVRPFEKYDYTYTGKFTLPSLPSEDTLLQLSFERLDTYAHVILNGHDLGCRENGNIEQTFSVNAAFLHEGENLLSIAFTSPITRTKDLPPLPGAFTTERLYTRRMQCTYGWDWVDRFVCMAIGMPTLSIRSAKEPAIADAYVFTKIIDDRSAQIGVSIETASPCPPFILTLQIIDPDGKAIICRRRYLDTPVTEFTLDIPAPRLWYPHGYGEQPIYTLRLLSGADLLHQTEFGIRTVKIEQITDEADSENAQKCRNIQNAEYDQNEAFSSFLLKVNGCPILCIGANWVPCTPFPLPEDPTHLGLPKTPEKITKLLTLAKEGGINMLRLWGGGAFETAHFYRECARLGILVTQDFLMACGTYPEGEDWFLSALREEAEYAARLARNCPALVWWSGDNENAVNGCETDADYPGRKSALFAIGPVLSRLDPYRPFLPSSPYGGKKYASNTVGTTHNTQYLGEIFPYLLSGDVSDIRSYYKRLRARFIAEEPQFGGVCEETLRHYMTDSDIFGDDDSIMRAHTKSNPALSTEIYDMTCIFARTLLGDFLSGEDRCFKLRYLQYEWIRLSLEQLRREMWFESGVVFWMWNDCWPAASGWAIVDYDCRAKDAYYAVRRLSKPLVISFDEENGSCSLVASNRLSVPIRNATVTLWQIRDGICRVSDTFTCDLDASSAMTIRKVPTNSGLTFAEITSGDMSDRTFFLSGAPLIHEVREGFDVRTDHENQMVTVTANRYIHALELSGNALFDDNCFSLLPGESRAIRYRLYEEGTLRLSVMAYTLSAAE